MSEGHVKVSYSAYNVILIVVFIIFLIAIDVFIIFISRDTLFNTIVTVSVILLAIYFIYLTLNRIKEISFYNDRIYINRFFLNSLTFEVENIKHICVKDFIIGKKLFNLRFVRNKYEVISFLLNTMKIANVDEATNEILNGVNLYTNEEDIIKTYRMAIIMVIIFVLALIASIIFADWPIFFKVFLFILMGVYFLESFLFEEKIDKINSKFKRIIIKGVVNIVCFALAIVLALIIYIV